MRRRYRARRQLALLGEGKLSTRYPVFDRGVIMRRDLIIGALCSLAVTSGFTMLSEWVGEPALVRARRPLSATIEVITLPKEDPANADLEKKPDPLRDPDPAQPEAPQMAPPMLPDVTQMINDKSFVQTIQPAMPSDLPMATSVIVIPRNRDRLGQVFDVSKVDRLPEAIVQIAPEYPFQMNRAGISGEVLIDCVVDAHGYVRFPYAASSTHRAFEIAAVQAVSKWRFSPGQRHGRAVNTHVQVPIMFSLNTSPFQH